MKTLLSFIAAMLCSMTVLQAQPVMKLVKDINPGYYNPSNPAIVGGLSNGKVLLFAGNKSTITYGSELWISDGTAQGTTIVKDIFPGDNNSVFAYTAHVFNDRLYFLANDGTGKRMYTSDGTSAGTYVLMDSANFYKRTYSDFPAVYYNGKIYFCAEDSAHGYELWCSDGTQKGTQLFMDVFPGTRGSGASYMRVAFGKLIFAAYDTTHGFEMWSSDGTVAGTKILADLNPGIGDGHTNYGGSYGFFNNLMYFQGKASTEMGIELYATDGNTAWLVKDIDPRPNIGSLPSNFTVVGNKLYFSAQDSAHGRELWVTDGTATGTQLVKDIEPGVNGSVYQLFGELNGKLIFESNTKAYGLELWTSDGTANGTNIIKDINAGSAHGKISTIGERNTAAGFNECNFIHNGKFYFAGNGNTGYWIQLWQTDGTAAGTKSIDVDTKAPPLPGINLEEVNWVNVLHDKVWVSYMPGLYDFELYCYDIYDTPVHANHIALQTRNVSVFPNPAAQHFVVQFDNNNFTSGYLQLTDMTGKELYSQGIQSGTRHLPVVIENLPAGVYNVMLKLDSDVIVEKLVVEPH